jgi:Ca2+-binding EF-hand superfamily protein
MSTTPTMAGVMTAQEEVQVNRVFNYLADYFEKTKIQTEITSLQNWLAASKGNKGNVETAETTVAGTQTRIDELNRQLETLKNKPSSEKKISCADVTEMLTNLTHKIPNKRDVEEIIWEVDENLDGCLDRDEFFLMFNRNIIDKTGLEPCRMYHLAQFLIYDEDYNGMVSVDETMSLLYARYGRSVMEQKLKELFGDNMHEFGRQGGEISFVDFVKSMEKVQWNKFLETNLGAQEKKKKERDEEEQKKKEASTRRREREKADGRSSTA